jgi:hypothetical protein
VLKVPTDLIVAKIFLDFTVPPIYLFRHEQDQVGWTVTGGGVRKNRGMCGALLYMHDIEANIVKI